MARTSSGKWVARAASTGGGRTYRGQVPVNWYLALVIIVILGVLSVVFSRYQYQHPAAASTVQPTTNTTWYAGLSFDVCGKKEVVAANATSSTASTKSFYTAGKGLIVVAPKTAAAAGDNAVLGKFVDGYHGMKLSSSAVTVPSGKKSTTYRNGQTCPSGTPDAGKKGQVQVAYWPSAFSKASARTVSGDPTTLKFSANQLITIGFVPAGTKLPKTGNVVTAVIQASTALNNSSTTTTVPGTSSTTTTAPASSTTTTAPATTTTAPTSSSSKK